MRARRGEEIHTLPETAVGEGDVRGAEGAAESSRGTSLWKDAWRRLLKNKLAVFGMVVVGFIVVAVARRAADHRGHDRLHVRLHPVRLRTLIKSFPPFTRRTATSRGRIRWAPTAAGRDILARVLLGGRISLMVGIISTFVSLIIGITYGATAGYLGGKVDDLMMRDRRRALRDPVHDDRHRAARLLRRAARRCGQLVPAVRRARRGLVADDGAHRARAGDLAKNQEFVLAARATGVSTPKIIFRHLVPNTLGPVIVYATLTIPSVMLQEAFLSFLGLGVQAPLASWGASRSDGIQNIAIFPWQLIFPGVTMALTLFSLNFLGDGLRDALDPQMRKFNSDE